MFNNTVLRIFGPKRDEVRWEWRKLYHEELNELFSSSIIFRVIKTRRMRWVGHVARMAEIRGVFWVLVVKSKRKRPLWNLGVDGRIILRWIFRK